MPIHHIIADEHHVAVYLLFEGKHTGIPFKGIEAKGNPVKFSLMMFLQIKDGKIFEKRSHVDVDDIIRQITL